MIRASQALSINQSVDIEMLTDSNKDDVTVGLVTPELLMFVRMGAPNPIDESCRLLYVRSRS